MIPPPGASVGRCPICTRESLEFRFLRPLKDVAAMIHAGEWVALEEIPMQVYCGDHFVQECSGREFTIDLKSLTVLGGFIKILESE